jgi:hypothetical protein
VYVDGKGTPTWEDERCFEVGRRGSRNYIPRRKYESQSRLPFNDNGRIQLREPLEPLDLRHSRPIDTPTYSAVQPAIHVDKGEQKGMYRPLLTSRNQTKPVLSMADTTLSLSRELS